MRALINKDNPNDIMTEDAWLDWFGDNGEALTGYMGYRLTDGELNEDGEFVEGQAQRTAPDPEAERIAELEAELRRLKHQ